MNDQSHSLHFKWKEMLINGGRVSPEWQRDAWKGVVRDEDPAALERHLTRTGPIIQRDAQFPEDMPPNWYIQEIANRMRQRARKAGLIEYSGKPHRWKFVPQDTKGNTE